MIAPPTTPLEQEIDLNWLEYPVGVGVFLTACENGTIKGTLPVSAINPNCGCAYGHITGLDKEKVYDLLDERRARFGTPRNESTPLEEEVFAIRPGETIENNKQLRALYTLILARKPEEKGLQHDHTQRRNPHL